jgi:hypothetical protein
LTGSIALGETAPLPHCDNHLGEGVGGEDSNAGATGCGHRLALIGVGVQRAACSQMLRVVMVSCPAARVVGCATVAEWQMRGRLAVCVRRGEETKWSGCTADGREKEANEGLSAQSNEAACEVVYREGHDGTASHTPATEPAHAQAPAIGLS